MDSVVIADIVLETRRDNVSMNAHGRRGLFVLATCAATTACTPPLNWRDVRPAHTGLLLQFPCRPSLRERVVPLAGRPVRLSLYACNADGQTWALEVADVPDPAHVEGVLGELRRDIAANVGAKEGRSLTLRVPGATPSQRATHLVLSGHRPDGRAVQMQVALFADATHVFQATALGERLTELATETFFASLRLER
jgi:hypothetical protein